jgi:hypothetical protein
MNIEVTNTGLTPTGHFLLIEVDSWMGGLYQKLPYVRNKTLRVADKEEHSILPKVGTHQYQDQYGFFVTT